MRIDNILIVCTANICRSAIAEQIMRYYCPKLTIKSAGIQALVGQGIDPPLLQLAQQQHIFCDTHQATQVTRELLHETQIILIMEQYHHDFLISHYPHVLSKLFYFGKWINNQMIFDPYKRSPRMYHEVFKLILKNSILWSKKLIGEEIVSPF